MSDECVLRHERGNGAEAQATITVPAIPFTIAVLGAFSGESDRPKASLRERRFADVRESTFDAILAGFAPRLAISVPNPLGKGHRDLAVHLEFRRLADFEPEAIARHVESLGRTDEDPKNLSEDHPRNADSALPEGMGRRRQPPLRPLRSRAAAPGAARAPQVDAILRDPALRKLEASWRGLRRLVSDCRSLSGVRIRILDATKEELLADCLHADSFDKSAIFRMVGDEAIGTLGGEPAGVILGDYELSHHPPDLRLLEFMTSVAAAAQAPFLSSASPALFGFRSFDEMVAAGSPGRILARAEYASWRRTREREEARFAGLALPRVLIRESGRNEGERGSSTGSGRASSARTADRLWGNPVYPLGVCLAQAFAQEGWAGAAWHPDDLGRLREGSRGHPWLPETELGVDLARELSRSGFLPFAGSPSAAGPVFHGDSSPMTERNRQPLDDAPLSHRLSVVLAASRVAQVTRTVVRQKHACLMPHDVLAELLERWISEALLDGHAPSATGWRPLRQVSVSLRPRFNFAFTSLHVRLEFAGLPGEADPTRRQREVFHLLLAPGTVAPCRSPDCEFRPPRAEPEPKVETLYWPAIPVEEPPPAPAPVAPEPEPTTAETPAAPVKATPRIREEALARLLEKLKTKNDLIAELAEENLRLKRQLEER